MEVVEDGREALGGPQLGRAEGRAGRAQDVARPPIDAQALEPGALPLAHLLAHGEARVQIGSEDAEQPGRVAHQVRARDRQPPSGARGRARGVREQDAPARGRGAGAHGDAGPERAPGRAERVGEQEHGIGPQPAVGVGLPGVRRDRDEAPGARPVGEHAREVRAHDDARLLETPAGERGLEHGRRHDEVAHPVGRADRERPTARGRGRAGHVRPAAASRSSRGTCAAIRAALRITARAQARRTSRPATPRRSR